MIDTVSDVKTSSLSSNTVSEPSVTSFTRLSLKPIVTLPPVINVLPYPSVIVRLSLSSVAPALVKVKFVVPVSVVIRKSIFSALCSTVLIRVPREEVSEVKVVILPFAVSISSCALFTFLSTAVIAASTSSGAGVQSVALLPFSSLISQYFIFISLEL